MTDWPAVRTISVHVPEQDVIVEVDCTTLTDDEHRRLLDRFRAAEFHLRPVLFLAGAPAVTNTPRLTVPGFDVGEIEEPDPEPTGQTPLLDWIGVVARWIAEGRCRGCGNRTELTHVNVHGIGVNVDAARKDAQAAVWPLAGVTAGWCMKCAARPPRAVWRTDSARWHYETFVPYTDRHPAVTAASLAAVRTHAAACDGTGCLCRAELAAALVSS